MRRYVVEFPERLPFFRFLKTGRAAPADFTADRDLGRRYRGDALLYRGVSVHADQGSAARKARALNAQYPGKSPFSHVAMVEIEAVAGHGCAKTAGPGHWTIWGEPEEFVSHVRQVFPL